MTDQTSPSNQEKGAGRLFLGIPLADELTGALAQHLAPAALPGRLVPPDKWHLTLRFLGDTSHETLHRLHEALRATSFGPRFEIVFDRLGAFPRPARASVLWLGVGHGAEMLTALAKSIESAVRQAGFAAESRAFASHLTVSRLQSPRDVRPVIEAVPAFRERMQVNDVILFRSHLGRGPSRYEVVERFALSSTELDSV
jgi:2'-5' RNA ligase